jgi:hypothetical protein
VGHVIDESSKTTITTPTHNHMHDSRFTTRPYRGTQPSLAPHDRFRTNYQMNDNKKKTPQIVLYFILSSSYRDMTAQQANNRLHSNEKKIHGMGSICESHLQLGHVTCVRHSHSPRSLVDPNSPRPLNSPEEKNGHHSSKSDWSLSDKFTSFLRSPIDLIHVLSHRYTRIS